MLDWLSSAQFDWSDYLQCFIGLASIINPFGNMPIFLSLTQKQNDSQRYGTAFKATFTLLIVLLIALMAGQTVLDFFGISVSSFQVAGGIVILIIALALLRPDPSASRQQMEATDAEVQESVAVVPLGIPILGGPGAISTVIVFAQLQDSWQHYVLVSLAILTVALLCLAIFLLAPTLASLFGQTGMSVITRVTGLIIAAIAIEFIADGIKELLPGLA